jgi:adenylate cyclase
MPLRGGGLLAELKRRKVVRVAAVYAATGFVVIQAAELLAAGLGLPGWVFPTATVLVVLGFPVALVLAWALELTPEGVRITGATTAQGIEGASDAPPLLGRRAALVTVALLLLGTGLGAGWFLKPGTSIAPAALLPGAGAAEGSVSLAVLPFTDLSPGRDHEWFSDGLTEELLNALSTIRGLRVAARTSTFATRGQNLEIGELAARLNVSHVLEGSVRRSGDRLRVSVQLILAAGGYNLWSQVFDRPLADVFEIQEEISRAIARELRVRLGGEVQAVARATDPATYDLYLRGLFHWRKGTREDVERAVEQFGAAVERDPGFALAWVGLADAYNRLANWGHRPPREVLPLARAAAQHAVELDSVLAPARATLGHTLRWWDHDRTAAGRELRRALELQPDHVESLEWYAWYLADEGRTGEAVELYRRAGKLDPLSSSAVGMLTNMLVFADRYKEAVTHGEHVARTMANPVGVGSTSYAYALYRIGRGAEAISMLERYPGRRHLLTAMLGYLYAVSGRPDDARQVLADFRRAAEREYVPAVDLALVHLGLGEHEAALTELERAWEEGSLPPQVNVTPWFEPLREHPRFVALVRNLGLTPRGGRW